MRFAPACFALLALSLGGCAGWRPYATDESVAAHVTVQQRTYVPHTGEFRVVLRNDSRRTIGYLQPLGTFSAHPAAERLTWFDLPGNLMAHARRLAPGRSVVITDSCRACGVCDQANRHYGVHVCWLDGGDDCAHLELAWTPSALVLDPASPGPARP